MIFAWLTNLCRKTVLKYVSFLKQFTLLKYEIIIISRISPNTNWPEFSDTQM